MNKAIAVARGCGTREAGALYLEVGLGPGGRPIEDFLVDPPRAVVAEALGLSPVGVKIMRVPNSDPPVYHVFDWVGSKHYPNVADFVEEARRFGISRRISAATDFEKLTEDSRLVLLHSRAIVGNHAAYYEARERGAASGWAIPCRCPKHLPDHEPNQPAETCAQLWWEDVEGGEAPGITMGPTPHPRATIRRMPSFTYTAMDPPAGVKPRHELGIFATFPVHRIVAVKDRDGGKHEAAAAKARASKLPVEFEDE